MYSFKYTQIIKKDIKQNVKSTPLEKHAHIQSSLEWQWPQVQPN